MSFIDGDKSGDIFIFYEYLMAKMKEFYRNITNFSINFGKYFLRLTYETYYYRGCNRRKTVGC